MCRWEEVGNISISLWLISQPSLYSAGLCYWALCQNKGGRLSLGGSSQSWRCWKAGCWIRSRIQLNVSYIILELCHASLSGRGQVMLQNLSSPWYRLKWILFFYLCADPRCCPNMNYLDLSQSLFFFQNFHHYRIDILSYIYCICTLCGTSGTPSL